MGGLHRRNFIGADADDNVSLGSFNRFHIFRENYNVVDDDPEKWVSVRLEIVCTKFCGLVSCNYLCLPFLTPYTKDWPYINYQNFNSTNK